MKCGSFTMFVVITVKMENIYIKRTALNLHDINSTRCWKQSSEILVHIDHTVAADLLAVHP